MRKYASRIAFTIFPFVFIGLHGTDVLAAPANSEATSSSLIKSREDQQLYAFGREMEKPAVKFLTAIGAQLQDPSEFKQTAVLFAWQSAWECFDADGDHRLWPGSADSKGRILFRRTDMVSYDPSSPINSALFSYDKAVDVCFDGEFDGKCWPFSVPDYSYISKMPARVVLELVPGPSDGTGPIFFKHLDISFTASQWQYGTSLPSSARLSMTRVQGDGPVRWSMSCKPVP